MSASAPLTLRKTLRSQLGYEYLIVVVRCTNKAVFTVSFAEQTTTQLVKVLINSQSKRERRR